MSWTDVITQAFNPPAEYGTDFGVPFHTPIPTVLGGTVDRINCGVGWRCEVDIASRYGGDPVTESYLHIDEPAVRVGQQVRPGDLVGLSGGQLSGGSNPDWAPFSTGPHVEFDIFRGGPFQNPIDPVNIARGGPSSTTPDVLNPFHLGQQLASGQVSLPNPLDVGTGIAVLGAGIAGIPASIGHGLADAVTAAGHNAGVFLQRQIVALVVAAVVLLVLFLA